MESLARLDTAFVLPDNFLVVTLTTIQSLCFHRIILIKWNQKMTVMLDDMQDLKMYRHAQNLAIVQLDDPPELSFLGF